jgi:hypothetical protein
VPLGHIADALSHVDTRMTALVYGHAVAPTTAAAVTPMEQMFG